MKGDKWVRAGPDCMKIIDDYQKLYGLKTRKEALAQILTTQWYRELYIKYILTRSDPTKEEPACLRRYFFEGSYWCAKHAPIQHEIPTLDMCKACKLNVIDRISRPQENPGPMMEEPPLVSDGNSETQDTRPTRPEIKAVYCSRNGGLYVKKSACDVCTFKCPAFQEWFK